MGKRGPQPGTPRGDKKASLNEDTICDLISCGASLTSIAKQFNIDLAEVIRWIGSDVHRSARVRTARQEAAKLWDEEATRIIAAAPDSFELSKAKELAHHYRWRASKIAPREYGDKMELTGDGGGPILAEVKHEVTWKKPDEC